MNSMDDLTRQWVSGWETACQKVKDRLIDDLQKVNDPEALKIFHDMLNEVQAMEKRGFSEMPTVISLR